MCEDCPRGLFASKSFARGDVIGRLNLQHHCIDLGPEPERLPSLLMLALLDPGTNATHGEYLKTLPGVGHVPSYFTLSEEHVEMLQSNAYSRVIKQYMQDMAMLTESFNRETHSKGMINWTVPPALLRHYMSLVYTRSFAFQGPDGVLHSWMCPIMDLLNHQEPGNAERQQQEDGNVLFIATQDIREGEELLWPYHSGLDRPDTQLLAYGFVEYTEEPALSAVDDPDFDPSQALRLFPSRALEQLSREEAADELERVRSTLSSLPTSEQEDREALARGEYRHDEVARMVLQWRVMRKAALRQRAARLQQQLGEL